MADQRSGGGGGSGGSAEHGGRGSSAGLALLGLLLGGALVLSTWIAADAFRSARAQGQTLEVKGFAELDITSDWASWRGQLLARGPELDQAYASLAEHQEQVMAFLREQGTDPGNLEISPVGTNVIYARDERGRVTNRIEAHELSLGFSYADSDIDLVARLARESASLVQQGIRFSSQRPQFFYTKLGEAKIDLLGRATADARDRARALAENSGAEVGPLRLARQGVFQITPRHSTEVSDYGRNDTSSREKTVKAVVTMRFSIQ